jgi:tetratricopeptide (TPR) repeat protein
MELRIRAGKPDQAAALGNASQLKGSPEVSYAMAKAQLAMAFSHSVKGDLPLAESLLKKLLDLDARNPDFRHHLGLAYFAQSDYKQALDAFEKAIKYRADFPDALYYKGLTLVRLKRIEETKDLFRELAQHAKGPWKAKGLYGLAMLFEAEGKWEAVEHHLTLSLAAAPHPDAMAYLSRVYLQEKRPKEAEEWARKALEKSPHHVEGTIALAEAMASRKQFNEAQALALEALRIKPFSCGLRIQSAKLSYEAGKLDASMAVSDSAIAVCPEEPMAYYYAGYAHKDSNRTEEAKRYFKTFRKLGGDKNLIPEDY